MCRFWVRTLTSKDSALASGACFFFTVVIDSDWKASMHCRSISNKDVVAVEQTFLSSSPDIPLHVTEGGVSSDMKKS